MFSSPHFRVKYLQVDLYVKYIQLVQGLEYENNW